jgi:glycosyltransferase domain-containing protein
MLSAQDYSMMIPTFNRPGFLNAIMGYLASKKVRFPILILDSSSDENKAQNRVAAKRYDLDVRHLEFDEDARFDFKIGSALREIDSDYVSLCADDDIVFVDAIEACIDELEQDATLAACHGIYLNFEVNQALVNLRVEYAAPSIDMDDVVGRACQLLMRYEALNYAIFRRRVMLDIIEAVSTAPADMFWELLSCLVPLASGKVKRLSRVYHGRRWNGATGRTVFDPATWIANDPEAFAAAFLEYRQHLFKYYEAKGVKVGPEARKTLTQAHVIYLCRELRDGTGIKYALAGTSSPLAKIDLISKNSQIIQLLAHDAWFGSKIRKIRPLGPGTWLGRKIRKVMGRSDVIDFPSHGVNFRSPQGVRAMLTVEMIADLSRYIKTSDGL